MIASGAIIKELSNHQDPEKLLDLGPSVDFDKGFDKEILNKMLKLFPQDEKETSIPKPTTTSIDTAADLGDKYAYIAPEPLTSNFVTTYLTGMNQITVAWQ